MFPAPAGINRHDYKSLYFDKCVPRASGDKPWLWLCFLL
ncbi:hypothetical protein FORC31_1090 [Escherichia coli]|nr:hypothetical protein FORC31_1090 [Escherichia coli]EMV39836.1 hypothetical protein ECBCE019MS13_3031 [Escherichia coli BCE019_MS-13]EMX22638.1 hypothetical protein ECMP0215661_3648 [Escherichia coli MP021566.1]ENA30302.1 hypothetical protein ECBCE007MS11_3158 [Escherichia coli BCE007_MS-11]ENA77685.1 hypothetical protein EC2730450_3051 [Escherichia coli 2730450]ENA79251.1 hypothetical protein EC2741950_3096 [Escherichia coli 2741950]ENB26691.1 hypothetical protein ECBCE030MS09_3091 [Escher